jgi:hypothetical protein
MREEKVWLKRGKVRNLRVNLPGTSFPDGNNRGEDSALLWA